MKYLHIRHCLIIGAVVGMVLYFSYGTTYTFSIFSSSGIRMSQKSSPCEISIVSDWQKVAGIEKTLVYSAFYDDRIKPLIRIIGITSKNMRAKLFCSFKNFDGSIKIILAEVNRLNEHHNTDYGAYYFLCPVTDGVIPCQVSLVSNLFLPAENKLSVINSEFSSKQMSTNVSSITFGVCVKELYGNYNKASEIIEFIELNLILGVTHFTIYNLSVGYEADCVLQSYVKRKILTLLPFTYNNTDMPSHISGQQAAFQDCLYRNMYKSDFLLMIDMDEYIVPHYKNATLYELVKHIGDKFNVSSLTDISSMVFRNAFFFNLRPSTLPNSFITPLMKTERTVYFHRFNERSKCIINPRQVIEMGNHFVWKHISTVNALRIPTEIAYLHHYRTCEDSDCTKHEVVNDTVLWFYIEEYTSKVKTSMELVNEICPIF